MVGFRRSRVVKAPQDRVWQAVLNGNNMVKWVPDRFLSWKVLNEEGNKRTVESQVRFFGRRYTAVSQQAITPPTRIESETIRGSGKGSKTTTTLTSVSGGTKVELATEARGALASLLSGILRKKMERELDRILDAGAKNIEALE